MTARNAEVIHKTASKALGHVAVHFATICSVCTFSLSIFLSPYLQAEPAAELEKTRAIVKKLPLERWFDGTVEAVRQSKVSAETSGQVENIFVDVGDQVRAGKVILQLVSTEQHSANNQAKAALAEAMANLEVENHEYTRIKEVYSQGLVSKADMDRVTGRYNVAKARVDNAKAAIKTTQQKLSYTEVQAPYTGTVSARYVELGEAVQPGTPLLSGFDPNTMRVETDLPQSAALQVQRYQQARVRLDNGDTTIPTKLILFPVADPSTSTVRVRLRLPEKTANLYPGQFVKVGFTVGETTRLLIPASSVVYRSEVSGVYVLHETAGPQLRQVRLGNRFGDNIEVLAGLSEQEPIAVDPVAAGIMAVNYNQ